jgi:hypothetical protein
MTMFLVFVPNFSGIIIASRRRGKPEKYLSKVKFIIILVEQYLQITTDCQNTYHNHQNLDLLPKKHISSIG